MDRLDGLVRSSGAGLAVVWGRRRVGKTRLLLEWCGRHNGLYTVADQSAPSIQREYLAEAVSARFPGFGSVGYPNWRTLLNRFASEARSRQWLGPVVFDEFPYLAMADPTLESVMQNWVDHEAKEAGLIVAIAGSSQRMMQGLVLDSAAPLYGRTSVALEVQPLSVAFIGAALGLERATLAVEAYSVWGGIPRYWELIHGRGADIDTAVEGFVLDPLGPLFHEPERLLLEETPPAVALRPLLDIIGAGVHRVSELAGRLGAPATSLSRPLARLVELGLVRRETPFGEAERSGKRSLYKLADPFFRLWFRVVSPHKALLTASPPESRRALWMRYRAGLMAESWEELCRASVPMLHRGASRLGSLGPWEPAKRYWHGDAPEWDIVARSADGKRLLLGEAKWRQSPMTGPEVAQAVSHLLCKGAPPVPEAGQDRIVYALFTPHAMAGSSRTGLQDLSTRATPLGEAEMNWVDAEAIVEAFR